MMVLVCILASKVSVALLPCQYLVLSGFKILAIVIGVSGVTFCSFCIFSMTKDTEYFFTCFFAFPVSSLGSSVTWLFKWYAIVKMLSLYCYCKRFLYVLHIPLPDSSVLNIFFQAFSHFKQVFCMSNCFSIHGTKFIFLFLWLMHCMFYLRNKVFGEILQSFVL